MKIIITESRLDKLIRNYISSNLGEFRIATEKEKESFYKTMKVELVGTIKSPSFSTIIVYLIIDPDYDGYTIAVSEEFILMILNMFSLNKDYNIKSLFMDELEKRVVEDMKNVNVVLF